MRLELKHISGYLPYGLKVVQPRCGKLEVYNLYGAKRNERSEDVVYIDDSRHGNYQWSYIKGVKPLLRPMSDLYKEIGGRVGINVIGKMFEPNGVLNFEDGNYYYGWNTHVCDEYQGCEIGWIESAGWFGIFFDTYDYDNQTNNFTGDYIHYSRDIAEYLDENKFDWRYNLLDQNLAINLNEIE